MNNVERKELKEICDNFKITKQVIEDLKNVMELSQGEPSGTDRLYCYAIGYARGKRDGLEQKMTAAEREKLIDEIISDLKELDRIRAEKKIENELKKNRRNRALNSQEKN